MSVVNDYRYDIKKLETKEEIIENTSNDIILNNHVKPSKNIMFDLGSPNSKFRDLYLSGNTIHINNHEIKSDDITIIFPSSVKFNENVITSNDGIVLGEKDDSNYVFDTSNLKKSSNISLTDSHIIGNSDMIGTYNYIDTNNSFGRCYFSFSKDGNNEIIGCLTTDDSDNPTATDKYKGSNTYAFRVYYDSKDSISYYQIYANSSSASYTSMYFTHYDYNIYSIGYIDSTVYFFVNGLVQYSVSSVTGKIFKGRIVTPAYGSNLTSMINFNKIIDTVHYTSGVYSDWTYNSTETPYKFVSNTTLQIFYDDATFLTIPYAGLWNIDINWFWSTSGAYIRKVAAIRKTDKDGNNGSYIAKKGSSSNFIANNLGNGAWVSDNIYCQVYCNQWDKITFYSQSGIYATSYTLRIRNIKMKAECIHNKNEDNF